MSSAFRCSFDPKLDLVLERDIAVPRAKVWRAWTEPELIKQWFTPAPWRTIECEIDLRPGGIFRTVMRGPEGEEFPGVGCILDVVPNERLVWTSVLLPGFRPQPLADKPGCESIPFTGVIELADCAIGTRYTATAVHGEEASSRKHAEMGFQEGWGAALDQLVALMRGL